MPLKVSDRLPKKCIIVEKTHDIKEAVRHLRVQSVIGVFLNGSDIGRHGILEWLAISSSSCTYLFNVQSLQIINLKEGLKAILENSKIVKVFHDCRRAADCFRHQFNIKLVKVFDTQVADFFIRATQESPNLITNKVNSLEYCLGCYLNIQTKCLFEQLTTIPVNPNSSLNYNLQEFLLQNVIYLRFLKQKMDMILRMPFRRCVDVYLQTILRKSDEELELNRPNLNKVPPELVIDYMQKFVLSEKLIPQDSSKETRERDPAQRYAEDCRKYQSFKYDKAEEVEMEHGFCYANGTDLFYSDRREIINFLLDRMYAGDSEDRSIVTMTPFEERIENLTDSPLLSENCNFEKNQQKDLIVGNNRNLLRVPTSKPKCSSESNFISGEKERSCQPFEHLSGSSDSSMSTHNASCFIPFINPETNKKPVLHQVSDANVSKENANVPSSVLSRCIAYQEMAEQAPYEKIVPTSFSAISGKGAKDGKISIFNAKGQLNSLSSESKASISTNSCGDRDIALNSVKVASCNSEKPYSTISGKGPKDGKISIFDTRGQLNSLSSENKASIPTKSCGDHDIALNSVKVASCNSEKSTCSSPVTMSSITSSRANKIKPVLQNLTKKNISCSGSTVDKLSTSVINSATENLKCLSDKDCAFNTSSPLNKLRKLLEELEAKNASCTDTINPNMPSKKDDVKTLARSNVESSQSSVERLSITSDSESNKNSVANMPVKNTSLTYNSESLSRNDEDPWAHLRAAFLEPDHVSQPIRKIRFIPAGMQC